MIGLIRTTILRQLKSPKYLIFVSIFPIILTLLIGGLIGKFMGQGVTLSHKTVYYMDNGNEQTQKVLEIARSVKDNTEFTFQKISSKTDGINKAQNDGDLFVDVNGNNIDIYVSNDNKMYYTYLQSMFDGIYKGVNTYEIIAKENTKVLVNNLNYKNIEIQMMSKSQTPTGFDYYAVVELTMMVLYILMFPMNQYYEDKKSKISQRIKMAGISNLKYILGCTIGYFILSFVITLPSFIFSKYILHTNWGASPLLCYAVIEVFALSSILLGTVVSFIFDEKEKAQQIIQSIIIPVFSFLGGSYFAISNTSLGKFGFILNISPLRWINNGIFTSIYEGKNTLLIETGVIYLLISILLVVILVTVFKRGDERI